MKKFLFVLFVSAGLISGCSKDNATATSYTPTCSGAVKSYKTDVAPIIQASCSGCHQNFSTYSQLYASRTSVRSMIVSGQMPQGSSLSTVQKDAIVCWMDNGAANN
jgi:PBP1b-binding outer membrane lipoprotein LpoB